MTVSVVIALPIVLVFGPALALGLVCYLLLGLLALPSKLHYWRRRRRDRKGRWQDECSWKRLDLFRHRLSGQ